VCVYFEFNPAFCRSPLTGDWFCFDDHRVTALKQRDVITKDAYLLFYERRATQRATNAIDYIVKWVNSRVNVTVDLSMTSMESYDASFDTINSGMD
jgi:hypothetical protein